MPDLWIGDRHAPLDLAIPRTPLARARAALLDAGLNPNFVHPCNGSSASLYWSHDETGKFGLTYRQVWRTCCTVMPTNFTVCCYTCWTWAGYHFEDFLSLCDSHGVKFVDEFTDPIEDLYHEWIGCTAGRGHVEDCGQHTSL